MKKQFFKTVATRIYASLFLTSVVLCTALTPAGATSKQNNNEALASITYTGVTNNILTFNISYANPEAGECILQLADDQGRILYAQKFSDTKFNKDVLVKTLGEKALINFIIKNGKNSSTQKFIIEPQTKVIEELVVKKL